MKETKKYWKGLEQLNNTADFQKYANKEFPEYLPIMGENGEGEESSRRDFLKLMGFGIAAVSLAACETPVKKAIPYVRKPETVDPSVANYYASTYVSGNDYCSVVVKTREGRPIKIEGNKLSKVSGGGSTPQVQASVLSLYDQERLSDPLIDGAKASWAEVDAAVTGGLASINGKVALVSTSIFSPSTLRTIDTLKAKYSNIDHIAYDPMSFGGMLDAYEQTTGVRKLPYHDFSKAKVIVSFGADILGAWPNKSLINKQFTSNRKLSGDKTDMSRMYAFEANLSLTGANADYRSAIKPSQEASYLLTILNKLTGEGSSTSVDDLILTKAIADLRSSKGNSIVVSGSNDSAIQSLVIAINAALENYGSTIDTSKFVNLRSGSDSSVAGFVSGLKSGEYQGVIFYNCNPVYDHYLGSEIAAAIPKLKLAVSTADRRDETSVLCKVQAPDSHYLESWNDFEPVTGSFSLSQPTISQIFNTRQAQQSFLTWGGSYQSYYDLIRATWNDSIYALVGGLAGFDAFWDKCLQDGVFDLETSNPSVSISVDLDAVRSSLPKASGDGMELVIYQSGGVGDGSQANNPWLQEMPDPITKATWDNYVTISPKQAEELGVVIGDMTTQLATLTVNGFSIEVPVIPQPGQAYNTVGLSIGYGRSVAGKVANGVGVNAYPFLSAKANYVSGVSVSMSGREYKIAQTQTHQTYMGRETVIQESLLSEYKKDKQAGRSFPKIATSKGMEKPYAVSLWKGHAYPNHHWGLMIDLNSCTGCGTCTIACQSENNIPVVGKQEVLNRREMHWIRIDRYYSSDATQGSAMEKAAENPEVTFQPMMCQQCNNAPCETVCPVAATTHSSEGLNQMTYNRCIGTRYCANNCPYKVRRFNWFKYHDNKQFGTNLAMNNDLGKMVLNPDVTVRARGVMEKCTFCVQRIQSGKLEAKKEGRRPGDQDVSVACASSCPSEALVFGDMKDPSSKISQMLQIKQLEKGVESGEPRAYHVLEEIRVMPNVWYLTKIRNKDKELNTEA